MVKIAMEQLYKDALRSEYKLKLTKAPSKEYRDHLYPLGWCYRAIEKVEVASSVISSTVEVPKAMPAEKTQVIESFKDFSKSLMQESDSDSIKLDKVEISLKTNEPNFEKPEPFSQKVIVDLSNENSFKARYEMGDESKANKERLKVIFIADTLLSDVSIDSPSEITEFQALFDESTALLFSKMVKAMKLDKSDYLLTAIGFEKEGKKEDCMSLVLSEIYHFKPELLITLGVSASHALIDTKQRLKDLHGNFYPISIDSYSAEVMPLFSPSLLNSAPHMKSITWLDMQKAMEKLAI